MTPAITLTLIILGITVFLFITERLQVDLVAMLVLVSLALTGLVSPEEAISGFSSTAVITVWGVFILSEGLGRTGVAGRIGRQVLRLGGQNTTRLLFVIMLTAGFLSAFMNNIGVTAMMLPVVLDISKRVGLPPSKLLIPLAYSSLFGGMITLIGTPPNILVSTVLADQGLSTFNLFDFTPMGLIITAAGIVYILVIGQRLLPKERFDQTENISHEMGDAFEIESRLFMVSLPEKSSLIGKTLSESRLGSALGLNVIGIKRNGGTKLSPLPSEILAADDKLIIAGRPDRLLDLGEKQPFTVEKEHIQAQDLTTQNIKLVELSFSPGSEMVGKTINEIGFRNRFNAVVLAIWRDGAPIRTDFQDLPLNQDDSLLIQGSTEQLVGIQSVPDFVLSEWDNSSRYHLDERMLMINIPKGSSLCGKTLIESQLGHRFGLGVMGIIRDGKTKLMPKPTELLLPGDTLFVKGKLDDVAAMDGLQSLEINQDRQLSISDLENEEIGTVEIVLAPQSTYAGKTIREINFREKFDLSVLAVWRDGRPHRFNLGEMPLRFGDALLVFGPWSRLHLLGNEPEFLVLTEELHQPPRSDKALVAVMIMVSMVAAVGFGLLPISIAVITAATFMVLTRCLSMEEAYRAIEWKAIFLIAGMLPLGLAMQSSGTAQYLAKQMIIFTEPLGNIALLGGIFLLGALGAQVMPNAVVTVLLAPIVITTASDMGVSIQALLMAVAIGASASFASPVGHPANLLVMGPGGYKFRDYIKAGLPMTIITFLIVIFVLPIFWPL